MTKRELRHHRLEVGTTLEVWDNDDSNQLTLYVESDGNDDTRYVGLSPAQARALAALLNMAADDRERRTSPTRPIEG